MMLKYLSAFMETVNVRLEYLGEISRIRTTEKVLDGFPLTKTKSTTMKRTNEKNGEERKYMQNKAFFCSYCFITLWTV